MGASVTLENETGNLIAMRNIFSTQELLIENNLK